MWSMLSSEQNVEIPAASLASLLLTLSRPSRCRCAWWAGLLIPAEFDKIIVKNSAQRPGAAQRCGPFSDWRRKLQLFAEIQGRNAMGIGILQLSNANALER